MRSLLSILCLLLTFGLTHAAEAPKLIWQLKTRHFPLAVVENTSHPEYLYVALRAGGVAVIQQTAHSAKRVHTISKRQLGNLDCTNLSIKGHTLYLSLGNFFQRKDYAGIASVDIRNPAQPRVLNVWKTPKKSFHGSHSVILGRKHAYLCAMEHGILVFDISTPTNIRHISSITPDLRFPKKKYNSVSRPNARHAALSGNTLFVAFDAGGVRAIDISNPARPKEIGKYINRSMLHKQQAYNEILVRGNIAYVSTDYAGMEILDISNPKNIKQLSWWNPWQAHTNRNIWFNSPGHGHQLSYHRKTKSLIMSAGDSELLIIDVRNPKKPFLRTTYGKPKNNLAAWGAHLGKDRIYLSYIKSVIPFKGRWSGIKCVTLPR